VILTNAEPCACLVLDKRQLPIPGTPSLPVSHSCLWKQTDININDGNSCHCTTCTRTQVPTADQVKHDDLREAGAQFVHELSAGKVGGVPPLACQPITCAF
jgi:hypothetical protein